MNYKLRIKLLAIGAFLLFFYHSYSQSNANETETKLKKAANKCFEQEDYAGAYPFYSQLLSLYPQAPNYNYRFGACILFTRPEKEKAVSYLRFAVKSPDVEHLAYYYLGRAFHLNYKFSQAIAAYRKFNEIATSAENKKYPVKRLIEMCTNGQQLLASVRGLDVLRKKELNLSDYYHAYDLKASGGGSFLIEPDEFKTKLDRENGGTGLIYVPHDKKHIFFSSYGASGNNGRDIYVMTRLPNGTWGTPQNLGNVINTPYDEDYPYYDEPRHTLYFSSKGHTSMGGYDIFKSVYDESTQTWSEPENMDFPINTPDDDILFIPDSIQQTAFFSSTRSSPQGTIDVYKIVLHINAPKPIIAKTNLSQNGPELGADSAYIREQAQMNVNSDTNKLIKELAEQRKHPKAESVSDNIANKGATGKGNKQSAGQTLAANRKNAPDGQVDNGSNGNEIAKTPNDSGSANRENTEAQGSNKAMSVGEAASGTSANIANSNTSGGNENNTIISSDKGTNQNAKQARLDSLEQNENVANAINFAEGKMNESEELEQRAEQIIAHTQNKDSIAKANGLMNQAKASAGKAVKAYQLAAAIIAKNEEARVKNDEKNASTLSKISAGDLIRKRAIQAKQDSLEIIQANADLSSEISGLQQQSQDYTNQAQNTRDEKEKAALLQQVQDLKQTRQEKEDAINDNNQQLKQIPGKIQWLMTEANIADGLQTANNPVRTGTGGHQPITNSYKDSVKLQKEIDDYNASANAGTETQNNQTIATSESQTSEQSQSNGNTTETGSEAGSKQVAANLSGAKKGTGSATNSDNQQSVNTSSSSGQASSSSNSQPGDSSSSKNTATNKSTIQSSEGETQGQSSVAVNSQQSGEKQNSNLTSTKVTNHSTNTQSSTPSSELEQANNQGKDNITQVNNVRGWNEGGSAATSNQTNNATSSVPDNRSLVLNQSQVRQQDSIRQAAQSDSVFKDIQATYSTLLDSLNGLNASNIFNGTAEQHPTYIIHHSSSLTTTQYTDTLAHIASFKARQYYSQANMLKARSAEIRAKIKKGNNAGVHHIEALYNADSLDGLASQLNLKGDESSAEANLRQYYANMGSIRKMEIADSIQAANSNQPIANGYIEKTENLKKLREDAETAFNESISQRRQANESFVLVPKRDYIAASISELYTAIIKQQKAEYLYFQMDSTARQNAANDKVAGNPNSSSSASPGNDASNSSPGSDVSNSSSKNNISGSIIKTANVSENNNTGQEVVSKKVENNNQPADAIKANKNIPDNSVTNVSNPPIENSSEAKVEPSSISNGDSNAARNDDQSTLSSNPLALSSNKDDNFEVTTVSHYSVSNPIPIDPPLPGGLIFKIQVGAFRKPIPQDLFQKFEPVIGQKSPAGLICYSAGLFKAYNRAKSSLGKIKGMGYTDAFIIAFYNGKRISMREALAMLGIKGVTKTPQKLNNEEATTSNEDIDSAKLAVKKASIIDENQKPLRATVPPKAKSLTNVKGLVFTVQIGAFTKKKGFTRLRKLKNLYYTNGENGIVRYNAGIYKTLQEARDAREIIVANTTAKDAFVVAYYNGERLSIAKAMQMLNSR